ncbi:olfactory receptor 10A3-like [Pseudophryne corroboree]|uniref:olfactory receptor 10A3-like n=1 Tax=Pseudophryne corroboree TaxID=495146 RepID=UPI003081C2C4
MDSAGRVDVTVVQQFTVKKDKQSTGSEESVPKFLIIVQIALTKSFRLDMRWLVTGNFGTESEKYPTKSMSKANKSSVAQFLLLGFHEVEDFQIPVFLVLMVAYVTTMAGNGFIIILVSMRNQLYSPMYYFLGHLSACDILISTNVTPKALQVVLAECFLLTVMSYDRYLAICDPLHYASIMNNRLPHYMTALSWGIGFIIALINYFILMEINFCGPNIIDHYFCDLPPLLELSCSDTSLMENAISSMTIVGLLQLCFVIVTYICISISITRISSSIGRQKAFSTCSSHLTVVCMYYGTLISINITPSRGYSLNLKKYLSLLNTVLTPLLNPLIYSLRNNDIKIAIGRMRSTRVALRIH